MYSVTEQYPADPIEIRAPSSKSLTHRYIIGAALASGESEVWHTLESEDIEVTRSILCEAGANMQPITKDNNITGWKIRGMAGKPKGGIDKPLECDVHESGTTCRLLTAILAAGSGLFRIFGRGRMHDRPIGALAQVLEKLGTEINWQEKKGYPPFIIGADGLHPALVDNYVQINMDESSQFFSGLLFAAPMANIPLSIELGGKKVVSWPYVGLTLQCMADFGINFGVQTRPRLDAPWIELQKTSWRNLKEARPGCLRVRVRPGPYKPGIYTVEGDWSGASYFLAAGALGKHPIKVIGLNPESTQGDRAFLDILRKMGARVETGNDFVEVFPSELHGVTLDMGNCPDLVPTVAVLAAYAKGSTRITNVAHLRLKESDRLAAPAMELGKTGVMVDCLSDGLLINGMGGLTGRTRNKPDCPKLPATVSLCAHNDHRIAMSLALLEMRDHELRVMERLDDCSVVRKSFPNFWELWGKLK